MHKVTSYTLKQAAQAVNVIVVYTVRVVSRADMTGYSGAVTSVRGWWGQRRGIGDWRYLGRTAAEAYTALPDDPDSHWGAAERLPF